MYDGFYNLDQKPFQLNADTKFFFKSAGHKRAIAYLKYGLTQGEGFVVVTGAPGTGKTMLVKEMYNMLEKDQSVTIGLMVTTQVGAFDTLRILAATFGIDYVGDDNKAILIENIINFLKHQAQRGKRVLLVVDEAQNLPLQSIEELRVLSNVEINDKTVFQIFFIGQEQLGQLLNSADMEQVRQRVVATYHLKALTHEETRQYILFRLEKAGWKNNPGIQEPVYESIYNFTQGVPRKINSLCERLLLFGFLEELTDIDLDAVNQVISEIEEEFLPEMAAIEPVSSDTVSGYDQSFIKRVENLEQSVANLTGLITKELELLRKVILTQSDMDEICENDENGHTRDGLD